MNFEEADRRYQQLQQEHQVGRISDEEFDNALREAMVQDAQGRWWAKTRATGSWNVYDQASGQWSEGTPPAQPPPAYSPSLPPVYQPQDQILPAASGAQAYPAPVRAEGPVSQGISILIYLASFFIPLVGIIIFFIFRSKPYPSDRSMATIALVVGIVNILLYCGCCGLSILPSLTGSSSY